jgi:FAD synthase
MDPMSQPTLLPQPVLLRRVEVIPGRGRGRTIGIPTINVSLASVPENLKRGIYACKIILGDLVYPGALHYGPRPAFHDTETMEIHVIDETIVVVPTTVDLEITGFIRGVENFTDTEALKEAIRGDIQVARAMLNIA